MLAVDSVDAVLSLLLGLLSLRLMDELLVLELTLWLLGESEDSDADDAVDRLSEVPELPEDDSSSHAKTKASGERTYGPGTANRSVCAALTVPSAPSAWIRISTVTPRARRNV